MKMRRIRNSEKRHLTRRAKQEHKAILRLLYDTESNGFVANATRLHCVGIIDLKTEEVIGFRPHQIKDALQLLSETEERIGHNIQKHDEKLITKLHGALPGARISDTFVIARTMFPNVKLTDTALIEAGKLTEKLRGKHSMKAWGCAWASRRATTRKCARPRLEPRASWIRGRSLTTCGASSMKTCSTTCFRTAAPTCDCGSTFGPRNTLQAPLELEHRIAEVCTAIEEAGVPFDERAAGQLQADLVEKKSGLEQRLKETYGYWYQPISPDPTKALFVPKRPNAKEGYWGEEWIEEVPTDVTDLDGYVVGKVFKKVKRFKGYPCTKLKLVEFNPKSRDHIARVLINQGWKPEKLTEGGKPQIDEETVESIVARYPEMDGLGEYMMLEKRLSQLCGTNNSLIQSQQADGRIHGVINPGGTGTGRCSHFLPNLAQVPSAKKPYGTEFRTLFYAPAGLGASSAPTCKVGATRACALISSRWMEANTHVRCWKAILTGPPFRQWGSPRATATSTTNSTPSYVRTEQSVLLMP
jgi:DNA polymerase-1